MKLSLPVVYDFKPATLSWKSYSMKKNTHTINGLKCNIKRRLQAAILLDNTEVAADAVSFSESYKLVPMNQFLGLEFK